MATQTERPISEGGCEVYINGLPADTTEEGLASSFGAYGDVVKTRLRRRRAKEAEAIFGFVLYGSADSAQAAIEAQNGKAFAEGGEPLEVALAREPRVRRRRRKPTKRGEEDKTQLFCANLPWSTEEDDLRELFAGHGEIVTSEVAKRGDGRSRGFGFVKFATEDAAASALESLQGHTFNADTENARELRLQYAREAIEEPKESPAPAENKGKKQAKKPKKVATTKKREKADPAAIPNQVYCSNLPADFKPSHLKHIFDDYSVQGRPFLSRRKGNRSRYGFIQLGDEEEVGRAIEDLNNAEFASEPADGEDAEAGEPWTLKCEKARPREQRAGRPQKVKKAKKPRAPRPDNTSRRIFCKGFPGSYSRDDLSSLFNDHGDIQSVRLRKRNKGGPFAHIVFKADAEAQRAVEQLNGHSFEEKDEEGASYALVVEMSRPRKSATAESAPAETAAEE